LINSGNLKHTKICDFFNVLDKNLNLNEEIRKHDGFTIKTENLFNIINDLVVRRNEIAHGSLSDILDNSIILSYVEFVEKYVNAIIDILQNRFESEFCLFKKDEFRVTIEKFRVYKGGLLGILGGKKYVLDTDKEILIERDDFSVFSSKIVDYREFSGTDDIVIKLDKKIKENQKFYVFDFEKFNTIKEGLS